MTEVLTENSKFATRGRETLVTIHGCEGLRLQDSRRNPEAGVLVIGLPDGIRSLKAGDPTVIYVRRDYIHESSQVKNFGDKGDVVLAYWVIEDRFAPDIVAKLMWDSERR